MFAFNKINFPTALVSINFELGMAIVESRSSKPSPMHLEREQDLHRSTGRSGPAKHYRNYR